MITYKRPYYKCANINRLQAPCFEQVGRNIFFEVDNSNRCTAPKINDNNNLFQCRAKFLTYYCFSAILLLRAKE